MVRVTHSSEQPLELRDVTELKTAPPLQKSGSATVKHQTGPNPVPQVF